MKAYVLKVSSALLVFAVSIGLLSIGNAKASEVDQSSPVPLVTIVEDNSDSSLSASTDYDLESPVKGNHQSLVICLSQLYLCYRSGTPAHVCRTSDELCASACAFDFSQDNNQGKYFMCYD